MELRQLRSLQAVLRHGSFTAAARARHVTQPALWAQVKGLEQELGVTLFERAGRGVRPTRACAALQAKLGVVLDDVAALTEHAQQIAAGRATPARIGTAPSGVGYLLAGVIARLLRRQHDHPFPEIVSITAETGPELLARGALDLACLPREHATGFPSKRLYDFWPAVLGAGVRGGNLDVRRLDGVPVATLPGDSLLRTTLDAAAHHARVSLRVVFESRDAGSLLSLAREGACTTVVPSEMLDAREHKRAARLVSGTARFVTPLHLCWRDEEALTPSARTLRDAILSATRDRG